MTTVLTLKIVVFLDRSEFPLPIVETVTELLEFVLSRGYLLNSSSEYNSFTMSSVAKSLVCKCKNNSCGITLDLTFWN